MVRIGLFAGSDRLLHIILNRIDQQVGLSLARLRLALHQDNRVGDQLIFDFGIGTREDHGLTVPLQIFQINKGHLVTLFGVDDPDAGDHAGQRHIFAIVLCA